MRRCYLYFFSTLKVWLILTGHIPGKMISYLNLNDNLINRKLIFNQLKLCLTNSQFLFKIFTSLFFCISELLFMPTTCIEKKRIHFHNLSHKTNFTFFGRISLHSKCFFSYCQRFLNRSQ
jgi:hypothetical protein